LYDATDLPELSWIEFPPESSWPSGDHASVIVGYSLKEEMNNFITSGPLTFFTNLLAYPPVIKIHDPATAAIGVGAYWVSYSKLFDKTIGYPSVTRLLIVKLSSKDDVQPIVQAFKISPISISIGESFAIDYTVSSNSGSGLKQVELWRKDESSDWHEIKPSNTLAGETDPLTGSFMDSPSAPGKYWYGVHVVDNAGNWNDERNSNTNGQPIGFEPLEVQVNPKPEVKGQQGYTRTNEYYDNSTATTCTPGSVSAVCSSIDTCVDCDGKCRPSGTAIGVDWVCNQGKWNYQHITRTNEYWDNSTATTCAPGSAKATCFSADTCVGCDGKCYSSGTDIGRGWACNKGKWDYQPKSLSDLGTYRTTFDRVLYDSDALMKIGNKGYNKGIQLYRGGEGILDFLGHTENFTAYFNLNRGYSGLIGLVGLDDKTANSVANVEVVFIGDNVELHRAILIPGELPSEVNIDVSGIQRLTVEAAYSTESAYIDLIDMDLQK